MLGVLGRCRDRRGRNYRRAGIAVLRLRAVLRVWIRLQPVLQLRLCAGLLRLRWRRLLRSASLLRAPLLPLLAQHSGSAGGILGGSYCRPRVPAKPRVPPRGFVFRPLRTGTGGRGMEGRGCAGPLNNYLRLQLPSIRPLGTYWTWTDHHECAELSEPPPSLARPT
jgi:hypothetical protein